MRDGGAYYASTKLLDPAEWLVGKVTEGRRSVKSLLNSLFIVNQQLAPLTSTRPLNQITLLLLCAAAKVPAADEAFQSCDHTLLHFNSAANINRNKVYNFVALFWFFNSTAPNTLRPFPYLYWFKICNSTTVRQKMAYT